ncbi:MAG: FKBP-type peptidyl-prolyl cis-trans isomerase, partial [Clostridiales bacterium]|nr:FKBP-type peptidyl-prolyl cis-trans isomerase [Clostridiales bacterium]
NFVRDVLNKYGKKFDYSNEDECNKLFALACTVDDEKTVKTLIRQKKAADSYPLIGAASLPVFEQISLIQTGQLHDDARVQLYLQAFLSDEAEKKLIYMDENKIDYFLKNTDGKTAADLLEERIKTFKYGNNKKGTMQKRQEEQTLKLLKKIQFDREHPAEKKMSVKKLILIACICIAAAAVIGTLAGRAYVRNNASSEADDSSAEEESVTDDSSADAETTEDTSADDETSADDTASEEDTASDDADTDGTASEEDTASDDADTDDTTSYSTDTSLVVEDGDTVNIDYTGYIDDVAFDGGSTDGAGTDLVIGSGSYIDDFEDQLIGANVGDTVTVTVTFPDDYGVDDLNGQEAVFEVTINGIYE